jgi:hypothetical protein
MSWTPENAPNGGFKICRTKQNYPVILGEARARVNWRVNAPIPPYGSIYDRSADPDRITVGYPAYSPHGLN